MGGWVVTGNGKAFCEQFVGEDAGLGKAVHAFANVNVYVSVVDQVEKVVGIDDFLWD